MRHNFQNDESEGSNVKPSSTQTGGQTSNPRDITDVEHWELVKLNDHGLHG